MVALGDQGLTYSAAKRTFREYLTQKNRHLSVGKYYRSTLKNPHSVRLAIHALVWVSFLYLTSENDPRIEIIGVFSALLVIKGVFFAKTAIRMGIPLNALWFPIVDFLYAVDLPLRGIRVMFIKNIRWN